jgi:hypothetical protein
VTIAAWQSAHGYSVGDLVQPTVSNGHDYRCTVGGTSGGSEPIWTAAYQSIPDGSTVQWVPYTIITPDVVRTYLALNPTPSQSKYDDDTLGQNVIDATAALERACGRHLVDRPGADLVFTTMLRAQVAIPALRVPASVTWGGSILNPQPNGAYWLIPDALQTGVYVAIQFRAFRVDDPGAPWYLADRLWFDKALDSPFYPGNYGGGYAWTSLPNDLEIVGDWGYYPGLEPGDLIRAVRALAAFDTVRPISILADVAITPAGGVINYSQWPAEARDYVTANRSGTWAVSVG